MYKKLCIIMMSAVLFFTLTACGKSEAATNADNLIVAIGEVTLNSEKDIIAAEEAVANLEEEDQKQLEFLDTLGNARIAYNGLLIEQVEKAIDNIGEVTLESDQVIKDARALYEEQADSTKEDIKNYNALQKAENTLSNLKIAEVEKLISEIGVVTLDAEDRYIAANTLFQKLSKDEKEAVSNFDVLDSAKETLWQLKKEIAEEEAAAEAAKKEKERNETLDQLMDQLSQLKDQKTIDIDGKQIWQVHASSSAIHFIASYKGTGNFIIKLLDSNQDFVALVVNEIGDYDVDKTISNLTIDDMYYIEIECSYGSWTCSWTGTYGVW